MEYAVCGLLQEVDIPTEAISTNDSNKTQRTDKRTSEQNGMKANATQHSNNKNRKATTQPTTTTTTTTTEIPNRKQRLYESERCLNIMLNAIKYYIVMRPIDIIINAG